MAAWYSCSGTTSACAENTKRAGQHGTVQKNYLRVRGEYGRVTKTSDAFSELPPRARRIHARREYVPSSAGTTSACAENTCGAGILRGLRRNYLRVRGEYKSSSDSSGMTAELPPRARRIHKLFKAHQDGKGTTSACAENTVRPMGAAAHGGNYLRARGEYRFNRA